MLTTGFLAVGYTVLDGANVHLTRLSTVPERDISDICSLSDVCLARLCAKEAIQRARTDSTFPTQSALLLELDLKSLSQQPSRCTTEDLPSGPRPAESLFLESLGMERSDIEALQVPATLRIAIVKASTMVGVVKVRFMVGVFELEAIQ